MSSTLAEYLASQEELVQEAALALPHQFSQCSYPLGALRFGSLVFCTIHPLNSPATRQAVYLCLSCPEARGLCSACSIACHTDHDQIELWGWVQNPNTDSDSCPKPFLDFPSETSAAIARPLVLPTHVHFIKHWKPRILPTCMAKILKDCFAAVGDHMIQKRSVKRWYNALRAKFVSLHFH